MYKRQSHSFSISGVQHTTLTASSTLYFLRNYGVLLAVSVVCCTPLIEKLWDVPVSYTHLGTGFSICSSSARQAGHAARCCSTSALLALSLIHI